ncbi:MAG: hypothetical protein NUV47_01540 [Patescibacteria group bacterium]|nr:hypothetical protein [Patescibacteria group bacterium]
MFNLLNKKIISFILVISLVIPTTFLSYPKKSEALFGIGDITFDPTNLIQNTITATKSVTSNIYQYALQYKETVLDGIAWYIAKAIIRQMTTSIVNWINSGFDGNPSFVTDPAGMFVDIADQEIGKFIEGSSDLNFLCKPFSIDIRIALAFRYRPFKQKITCTFTDIVNNATNAGNGFNNSFIKGNFSNGGWGNWLSLTQEPQNNYIGASLLAEEELSLRIANKQAARKSEIDWGKGFLSWKSCKKTGRENTEERPDQGTGEGTYTGPERSFEGTGEGYVAEEHCEIQTPGTVIESGLENVLGSGVRQLELADEFNEIVNALFAQLIKTVITGGSGLKGTSGSGSFDSTSYINKISQQQSPEDIQALQNIKTESIKGIDASIKEETTYNQNKNASLSAVIKAKNLLVSAQSCYQQKSSTAFTQAQIVEIGDMIAQSITPLAEPLLKDVSDSNDNLIKLNNTKTLINNAKTVNDTVTPTSDYQNIIQNQILHDTTAVVNSEVDRDDIITKMAVLESQANIKLQQCQLLIR